MTDIAESIDDQLRGWLICNGRFVQITASTAMLTPTTPGSIA